VGDTTGSLKGTPLKGFGEDYHRAIHGSLDAAKALHEAVLLGWFYWKIHKDTLGSTAELRGLFGAEEKEARAMHVDPARAWLIAILKALIAEEK